MGRDPLVGYEAAVDQLSSLGFLPQFRRLVSVGYWNDILRIASWARFVDRLHLLAICGVDSPTISGLATCSLPFLKTVLSEALL